MNKKTLKALKGSIKNKWGLSDEEFEDWGSDNCDLCQLFDNGCVNCGGERCPVDIASGGCDCDSTPYQEWYEHYREAHTTDFPLKVLCKECSRLKKKEEEFLRSLLPEGEEV